MSFMTSTISSILWSFSLSFESITMGSFTACAGTEMASIISINVETQSTSLLPMKACTRVTESSTSMICRQEGVRLESWLTESDTTAVFAGTSRSKTATSLPPSSLNPVSLVDLKRDAVVLSDQNRRHEPEKESTRRGQLRMSPVAALCFAFVRSVRQGLEAARVHHF